MSAVLAPIQTVIPREIYTRHLFRIGRMHGATAFGIAAYIKLQALAGLRSEQQPLYAPSLAKRMGISAAAAAQLIDRALTGHASPARPLP